MKLATLLALATTASAQQDSEAVQDMIAELEDSKISCEDEGGCEAVDPTFVCGKTTIGTWS